MCQFLNSLGVHHAVHQPLGVDADVFRPERRTLDLRAKLGLPDNTRLLAYAGRFSGEKKSERVAARVRAAGRAVSPAAHRRGQERTADTQRHDGSVPARSTRAGSMARIRGRARACRDERDFRSRDSRSDGVRSAGDRRACRSDTGDRRRSVGLLARPNDGESMAETIAALYDRDIEAVGMAARARVLKQFTWAQAFTSEMNVYASLVSLRRLPVPARAAIEFGSPTS